jgi:hypothetical protein
MNLALCQNEQCPLWEGKIVPSQENRVLSCIWVGTMFPGQEIRLLSLWGEKDQCSVARRAEFSLCVSRNSEGNSAWNPAGCNPPHQQSRANIPTSLTRGQHQQHCPGLSNKKILSATVPRSTTATQIQASLSRDQHQQLHPSLSNMWFNISKSTLASLTRG